MAIELNKRKRKHNSTTGGDDGAEVVPKKLAKKLESPQGVKQHLDDHDDHIESNGNPASEGVSGVEPQEKEKYSSDFKILDFRAKLRGTNFATELRHFLHLAKTRPKIIVKYLEKRGKPLEVAEALERIDRSNVLHIGYICEALQLVLMEIISNQATVHMESAVHACRYFLKNHGPLVDLLLKSDQLAHRRIALKLLTAVVCVEPQLGRQVLTSYDILSNVKTIENFLSHSPHELQQSSDPEADTVRKCFIHFVLAYLVDGNTLLIRNILDRGPIIRTLASGLQYDDSVTVCVVLSTLRKYVLECPEISKTKKIHVFDLECCKSFVRLYDWCGPRVFAAKCSGKKGKSPKGQMSEYSDLIDPQDSEAVAQAVHEFLIILLTSRKFGITFDAVKYFRQRHNTIQGQIVGFLKRPWSDERRVELVVKILEACPDLMRNTVRNFAGIVNPMRTPRRYWLQALDFLTQIIATCRPCLLRGALDKITLTDFSFWIKDICFPIETLVHLTGSKQLLNPDFAFRIATNKLLLAMFTQYTNYMAALASREQNKGSNSLRRFKFDILNHMLLHFPTIEDILSSLNMSIKTKEDSGVDVLAHLEVALDLVLIICQENQTFVNKTSTILDYLELLRPLYASDDEEQMTEANRANIRLEMKAIKTILLLFPKALEPDKQLFGSVLKSFIKAFVFGEAEISHEAGALLHGIFKNTGLFDSGELEIDLWLEALRFFDVDTVNVVSQVFHEVLQVTNVEVDIPQSTEIVANKENLHKLFDNIEKGLSVQAYVESLSLSKFMPLIFKGVEIARPLSKYLETVCLLMFYYYPKPENVLKLYEMEFKRLSKYMNSWLIQKENASAEEEMELDEKFATVVPHLRDVQQCIVKGVSDFEKIYAATEQSQDCVEMEFQGNTRKFKAVLQNERMIMIYVQQVLFCVAQLVGKQKLGRAQAERAAQFIISLLECLKSREVPEKASDTTANPTKADSFVGKMLKYIFGVRLNHIGSAELFSAPKGNETHLNYLLFLRQLTDYCNSLDDFDVCAANYKLKVVKAVAISLQSIEETKSQSDRLEEFIKLVQAFNLNAGQCVELLDLLALHLKYSDYFVEPGMQRSIYYQLLVCVLQQVAVLKRSLKCDQFVRRFCKVYTQFFRKLGGSELALEELEEAFHNFLVVAHQYIPALDAKFFECFFVERKLTKASIRLAYLLLERDEKLHEVFLKHVEANIERKELMYPLLEIAFRKQLPLEDGLVERIYQSYKNGFMRTVEKPQKASVIYKEHVDCSVALIERCMPPSECRDFCNKQLKFDVIELYQMRIINAIYRKALLTEESLSAEKQKTIFVNFIHLQVQMLALDLKSQRLNEDKLELFAYTIQSWFGEAGARIGEKAEEGEAGEEQPNRPPDFGKLLKSQVWLQFCKSCLKTGMRPGEGETEVSQMDRFNGLLLKLLAYLCDRLYVDYTDDMPEVEVNMEPAQLYEMIQSHSKFADIVLNYSSSVSVKTQVLHLLYTLAKKCPSALSPEQIPVILGSYQAHLTDADRYGLALLQLFEHYDCGLQQYRPLIWGESAIAFYALRAADAERTNLTQQETSIAQVMSLIDRQVCEYTIDNFPIWRKLNTLQQLPQVVFENPDEKAWRFGANHLERRIELGCTDFSESDLRLCPKRSDVYEQCYDPAFMVPLMSMCFAPESYAHPARPVQNGLLAVVFTALSSQDRDMRLAAACAQLRYRAHFENSKFLERPLWIQTYENIQAGLSELRDAWMRHKGNSGTPRVPLISALFVAKALNLTTDPTHLLYKPLMMYLRLKSSFNFQCIPEFNVLFYSAEIEHREFRQFIVEVIRNGIKSGSDLFLLVTTNTFKVLMGFYGSPVATLDMNLMILSLFSTCVKIPASTKIMIENVGILSWLSSIVSSTEFYHFDVIEGLIGIVNNLWYALKANAAEFHNFAHLMVELHRLILQLVLLLSPRISVSYFAKLLNIMRKTALHSYQYLALSSEQLAKIVGCAEKHFGSLVLGIESIQEFGGAGALSHEAYCKELQTVEEVDYNARLALSSLRSYVIDWWRCHNEAQRAVPEDEGGVAGECLDGPTE